MKKLMEKIKLKK
jgi:hypothetical protein